jgi:hypothetical protein
MNEKDKNLLFRIFGNEIHNEEEKKYEKLGIKGCVRNNL